MASAASEGIAVGIDLGTTFSCVAVWRNGKVEVIPNEHGNRTTPSYVAFTDNGRLFGDAARNQAALNPTNTVFDAKRLIGRRFSDLLVQRDMKLWPFKVVADANGSPKIMVAYKGEVKQFVPEEISAMILTKMKEIAETYLGTTVNNAVITVPAYFSDSQRRATKDAGVIAGLNVLRIINEPMAAAIAYELDKEAIRYGKKNVLVFDLGGGTLDVCLVTLDGVTFKVNAVAGNNHLGGEDFDDIMVNHIIQVLKKKYEKDITTKPKAIRRLRTECEKAKRYLSISMTTTIEVDNVVDGIDFQYTMSRAEFEHLNQFLFKMCIECVDKCIRDAKMEKTNIDEVVLVGGSTRIPYVQKMLEDFFNGKKLCKSLNPDEAIAYGAATYAAMLNKDVIQKKPPPEMDILEVIPLSLGINVMGNVMQVLIPKNTTIPIRIEKIFTTVYDYQKVVSIQVLEGEGNKLEDNELLGKFDLSGIPPAPKGIPEITVCFEINANGILNVTAMDRATGLENKITITRDRSKLTMDNINKSIDQDKIFKIKEEEYRQLMVAKNTLEELIYGLEIRIKDEKLSMEEKKVIQDAIKMKTEWKNSSVETKVSEYNTQIDELKRLEERISRGGIGTSASYNYDTRGTEKITQQLEMIDTNDKYKNLIVAKNSLDYLINSMEDIIRDEKISLEQKLMIEDTIKRTTEWKKSNNMQAEASEFKLKVEQLEGLREQVFRQCIHSSDMNEYASRSEKVGDMYVMTAYERPTIEELINSLANMIKSEKISLEEKIMVEDAIKRTIEWKKKNMHAKNSDEELQIKLKELESLQRWIRREYNIGASTSTFESVESWGTRNLVTRTAVRMVTEK